MFSKSKNQIVIFLKGCNYEGFGFCKFKEYFAVFAYEEQFILKKITEEESEEADEFYVSKNYLGQSSSKNISKFFSWVFYVFQI